MGSDLRFKLLQSSHFSTSAIVHFALKVINESPTGYQLDMPLKITNQLIAEVKPHIVNLKDRAKKKRLTQLSSFIETMKLTSNNIDSNQVRRILKDHESIADVTIRRIVEIVKSYMYHIEQRINEDSFSELSPPTENINQIIQSFRSELTTEEIVILIRLLIERKVFSDPHSISPGQYSTILHVLTGKSQVNLYKGLNDPSENGKVDAILIWKDNVSKKSIDKVRDTLKFMIEDLDQV